MKILFVCVFAVCTWLMYFKPSLQTALGLLMFLIVAVPAIHGIGVFLNR